MYYGTVQDYSNVLENVEHCGGEPEQADTACLLPNWNGCQEKGFMSSV